MGENNSLNVVLGYSGDDRNSPWKRHPSGACPEWRRLLAVLLLVFFITVFILHVTLSLVSSPPPACSTPYTQVPKDIDKKNKILLAAYYRGGSSFFGKLFQSNQEVLYWFEPLRPLSGDFKYHLQQVPPATVNNNQSDSRYLCPAPCPRDPAQVGVSLIRAIFSCDIATVLDISQQIIAYAQMRLYVPTFPLVFDKLGRFSPLPYKIQPGCIAGNCDRSDTIAAKTIRLRMRDVEPILAFDPKVKVIYYSRDPHGIMSSLTKLEEVKRNTVKGMCAIMEDDFLHYQSLEKTYPGRVMWVRYEDLALRPDKVTERVYTFFSGKKCIPPSVHRWLKDNTNAKPSEYNGITGTRRNSTANAREWQHIISNSTKAHINHTCRKVLKLLRYDSQY